MSDEEKGYRIEDNADGNTYLMLNGGCCERIKTEKFCEEVRKEWVANMDLFGHPPLEKTKQERDMMLALKHILSELSKNGHDNPPDLEVYVEDAIKRNGGTIDE